MKVILLQKKGEGVFLGWITGGSYGFTDGVEEDFHLTAEYQTNPGGDPTPDPNPDPNPNPSKEDPTYTVPTGLEAYEGEYLGDVELPEGFSWQDETTTVDTTKLIVLSTMVVAGGMIILKKKKEKLFN